MCKASVLVVQDHESGMFLCPYQGSVGYTPLIKDAGRFYDSEEAVLTAVDHCEGTFTVVELIEVAR